MQLAGILFPQRSPDAAPIFTPPVSQSFLGHAQADYGLPVNSSTGLDEAMAADMGTLRFESNSGIKKYGLFTCKIKLNDSIQKGLGTKLLLPFCSPFITNQRHHLCGF